MTMTKIFDQTKFNPTTDSNVSYLKLKTLLLEMAGCTVSRGEARTEPVQEQAASQAQGAALRNWRLASSDSGPSSSEDTDTAVKSRVSL